MSKIKIAAVAVIAVIVVSLCAMLVNGVTGFPQPGVTQQQDDEAEDCDAEDWINREGDCEFTKRTPAKTAAPKLTPRKTTAPRPSTTRR